MNSPPTVWFPLSTQVATPVIPPPPLSFGSISIVNGQHVVGGGPRNFFGWTFDQYPVLGAISPTKTAPGWALYPPYQAMISAHLDNVSRIGNCVRIHGLDESYTNSIFWAGGPAGVINGQITDGTTRQLDPSALASLDFFIGECAKRDLRICLTLNFGRQLTINDRPPWSCAFFDECLANGFGNGKGFMAPWKYLESDGGFAKLEQEYISQILRWCPPSLGGSIALGDHPVLGWVVCQNETSFPHLMSTDGWPSLPLLNAAWEAAKAAYSTANGITKTGPYALTAPQLNQLAAQLDTKYLADQVAFTRTQTRAVIVPGTYFGNSAYPILIAPYLCGDAIAINFYSRELGASESNGFLSGTKPTDARTRFSAALGGCTWIKGNYTVPLICTEFGPQGQYGGDVLDPDSERSQMMNWAISAMIAQGVQAAFPYSYAHAVCGQLDMSPFVKLGPYDLRKDFQVMSGIQTAVAAFQAKRNPPASVVQIPLSSTKLYGDYSVTPHLVPGPYNDVDLAVIPQASQIQMAPSINLP